MVNEVTLIGYLGDHPDYKELESGRKLCKFSMATSESWKDAGGVWQEETEWHSIVAWGGLSEAMNRNLRKGGKVYVKGKIKSRIWQDNDGNNRKAIDIVATAFRSLEKREVSA